MQINRFEAAGLNCIEVAPDEVNPDLPLLIGLHGRGDWGESYVDLAELISETDYRFIFPNAPLPLPGAFFEWFRFESANLGKEAATTRQTIFQLLEELMARYTTPASRTFLFGFSQGGMMTLEAGLRYRDRDNQRLAGLAVLSGMLLADAPFQASRQTSLASYYASDKGDLKAVLAAAAADQIPLFAAHGIYDPVIPVGAGRSTREVLQQAGLVVEYYEFQGEHQIILPEIQFLRQFIIKSLAKND
ncbi:MAG: hypothetical protein HXX20_11100 [Chloroflexi bacterium]|nr:hypothetical protein [Chloroflexota bacterium]